MKLANYYYSSVCFLLGGYNGVLVMFSAGVVWIFPFENAFNVTSILQLLSYHNEKLNPKKYRDEVFSHQTIYIYIYALHWTGGGYMFFFSA